jgi:hypothetical protein
MPLNAFLVPLDVQAQEMEGRRRRKAALKT